MDEGTTVTDYDEEAIARKHTLAASAAYLEWNKQKINLIDTPGMGNFFADAGAALTVADAAIVVVDAVGGVMVQTEKIWTAAEAIALPRLVVVNRLDRDRATSRSRRVHPVHRSLLRARADAIGRSVNSRAWWTVACALQFADDGSGKVTEGDVPADLESSEVGP